jgi:hypothetical protein
MSGAIPVNETAPPKMTVMMDMPEVKMATMQNALAKLPAAGLPQDQHDEIKNHLINGMGALKTQLGDYSSMGRIG